MANENPLGSTSEVYANLPADGALLSPSAFHGVGGDIKVTGRYAAPWRCIVFRLSCQVQVCWLFLHASLVLGAVRLTFEAFPTGKCC